MGNMECLDGPGAKISPPGTLALNIPFKMKKTTPCFCFPFYGFGAATR